MNIQYIEVTTEEGLRFSFDIMLLEGFKETKNNNVIKIYLKPDRTIYIKEDYQAFINRITLKN